MASAGGSLDSLVQVYKFVVEDVIKNVKEDFLNEGVEPEVLDQLQELWLRKEDLTDAVNRPRKPQLDPAPPPPPPSHHLPDQSPRVPPALIHQPLHPPTSMPHRSTGTQSQTQQGSVIQLAPRRLPQTTPNLPVAPPTAITLGTLQPSQLSQASPSTAPSLTPSQQLQIIPQSGYQVTMTSQGTPPRSSADRLGTVGRGGATAGGVSNAETPPTTSSQQLQAAAAVAQLSRMAGVTGVTPGVPQGTPGIPGLMQQLVVNPTVGGLAALQNQQVLVPMQTSQGAIMVPLASVLAMQQVATASQQNQSNKSNSEASAAANIVHQIDGFPPDISSEDLLPPLHCSSDISGCVEEDENEGKHSEKDVSADEACKCEEDPVISGGVLGCDESSPHQTTPRVSALANEECISNCDDSRTAQRPNIGACKRKDEKACQGFPPGMLGKLLRQQRRRKKQGKVGGIPVEVIVQLDGGSGGGGKVGGKRVEEGEGSSSENDSDDYGDSSDEEEVDQVDEDPLGSGDDEADSETEDKDFDTEDTVACQWEKVYRVKTRWKFQLKDGIMRMGGFEYVFQKANGEAEW